MRSFAKTSVRLANRGPELHWNPPLMGLLCDNVEVSWLIKHLLWMASALYYFGWLSHTPLPDNSRVLSRLQTIWSTFSTYDANTQWFSLLLCRHFVTCIIRRYISGLMFRQEVRRVVLRLATTFDVLCDSCVNNGELLLGFQRISRLWILQPIVTATSEYPFGLQWHSNIYTFCEKDAVVLQLEVETNAI